MKNHKNFIKIIALITAVVLGVCAYQYIQNNRITQPFQQETVIIQAKSTQQAPVSYSMSSVKSTVASNSKAASTIKSNRQSKFYNNRIDCGHSNSNCSSSSDCCGSGQCNNGVCQ